MNNIDIGDTILFVICTSAKNWLLFRDIFIEFLYDVKLSYIFLGELQLVDSSARSSITLIVLKYNEKLIMKIC